MKHLNKIILSALIVGFFMSSCIKEDINEGITNTEQTIVKLPQGEDEIYAFALDAVPGEIDLEVLDVRRDVKSESDLSKTNIVKISPNPTAIADYNAAHGTSLQEFTQYTLDPATPFDGQNWSVTFGPGDFARAIKIKFDPATLDLTQRYAMAFKISDPGGLAISGTKSTALVEIAVKNKYDGMYELTGTMVDLSNATLTGYFPQEVAFVTTGSSSVVMIPTELGIPGHLILSGGALSYYGSYGPTFNFDPATDKVATVTNSYGQPAGNTRSAELDPSGLNQWDPATKELNVKYFMKQPSVIAAPPHIRVTFDENFKYLGPR
jgi:Domain of unknown function (DUF1735)